MKKISVAQIYRRLRKINYTIREQSCRLTQETRRKRSAVHSRLVNDFSHFFKKVRGHSVPARVAGNDFYACRYAPVDYHNKAPYLMAR
jgi:hypothetical protein